MVCGCFTFNICLGPLEGLVNASEGMGSFRHLLQCFGASSPLEAHPSGRVVVCTYPPELDDELDIEAARPSSLSSTSSGSAVYAGGAALAAPLAGPSQEPGSKAASVASLADTAYEAQGSLDRDQPAHSSIQLAFSSSFYAPSCPKAVAPRRHHRQAERVKAGVEQAPSAAAVVVH